MIPTTKKILESNSALKRVIKVDLLFIFCWYYTARVTKTRRIRTDSVLLRGLGLQINLPVLTLLMPHNLCLSLCTSAAGEIPRPPL
jgi:hypothetical protein